MIAVHYQKPIQAYKEATIEYAVIEDPQKLLMSLAKHLLPAWPQTHIKPIIV